jgi:hypothetical protein
MKKRFKSLYLIISSIVIGILHLPFAFAKSATTGKVFFIPSDSTAKTYTDSVKFIPTLKSVYDSLQLNVRGLSYQAYEYAKQGLNELVAEGRIINGSIISIIDFSLPSDRKRLFVIDLDNYKILFNTLVAHGRNTGVEIATSFSNKSASHKSSPGFYITEDSYVGRNGLSLKLIGIEKGINDNAFNRGIVIHGANYVSESLANAQGYIGRSEGCPAIPESVNRPIINTIKNGTCLFIYHPNYVERSSLLR